MGRDPLASIAEPVPALFGVADGPTQAQVRATFATPKGFDMFQLPGKMMMYSRSLNGVRKRVVRLPASTTFFLIFLLLALPSPLLAYGDPTGGALFQILGPLLALIWGAWMIFANNVRKRVGNLFRKLRGSKELEPEP